MKKEKYCEWAEKVGCNVDMVIPELKNNSTIVAYFAEKGIESLCKYCFADRGINLRDEPLPKDEEEIEEILGLRRC